MRPRDWMRAFRLPATVRRVEADVDAELAFHIAECEASLRARGLPEAEARRRLVEAGLRPVVERRADAGGSEPGTVADVRPTGLVDPGAEVRLTVWVAPAPAEPDTSARTSRHDEQGTQDEQATQEEQGTQGKHDKQYKQDKPKHDKHHGAGKGKAKR